MAKTAHFRRLAAALALVASFTHAEEIKVGGTGAALGTFKLLAVAYREKNQSDEVRVFPSMGSSGGMKALLAGAIDIALTARMPTGIESNAGAVGALVGHTPFVFATHASNRASDVSLSFLAAAYSGVVTEWPDGTQLRLVLRPASDADSEIIRHISQDMGRAVTASEERKGMLWRITDQETADSIEQIPGSLGPSSLALINSENRKMKALKLDGVAPDVRSMADGRYPLMKSIYAVTGRSSSPAALQFVDFLKSRQARAVLERAGYWVH